MASRLVISLLFATSVALDERNLRDARAAADLERRSGGQDLSARAADLERRSGGRDMKMGYQPETDAPTTAPTAAPTGPCGRGVEESPKDSIFNSTSLACECPEDKEYKRMEPPGSPQAGMWICSATQCHPAATLIQTPSGSVRIDELKIGDEVMAKDGPTTVISVIHETPDLIVKYEKLTTADGSVTLAPDHMLLVNGEMAGAATAAVGNELMTPDGSKKIINIEHVEEPGAYHIYVNASTGYFAADPDSSGQAGTFFLSSNLFTAEHGAETFDEWNLGMLMNGTYTLEMLQWSLYIKAKTCYAINKPLPSIDIIGWAGVLMTPCELFPYVAGLP